MEAKKVTAKININGVCRTISTKVIIDNGKVILLDDISRLYSPTPEEWDKIKPEPDARFLKAMHAAILNEDNSPVTKYNCSVEFI